MPISGYLAALKFLYINLFTYKNHVDSVYNWDIK